MSFLNKEWTFLHEKTESHPLIYYNTPTQRKALASAQVLTVCQAALAISHEPFPLQRRLWLWAALASFGWREVAARHLWAAKLAVARKAAASC